MKKEESGSSTELQKLTSPNIDVLNFDITNNLKGTLEVLTKLVASKALKDKVITPENALGLYVKTKELGLPFMAGIDHIIEINGKLGLDVHAMRALVLRAGTIHWEIIHDNVPLYKYIDKTGTVIARGVDDTCLPTLFEVPKGKTEQELAQDVKRIESIGKYPVFANMEKVFYTESHYFFNYTTRYKFTRKVANKELVEYGEFTNTDFVIAGLHLKRDNNVNMDSPWIKYNKNMREHRAWTFGARKIADDILFGLLETTELYDINHVDYTIEDGVAKEITIDDNHNN